MESVEWTPRYVAQKAEGVGGPPIPPDEPFLIIRAQDFLAADVMSFYQHEYAKLRNSDPQVLEELDRHMAVLLAWRATHPHLIKVADR